MEYKTIHSRILPINLTYQRGNVLLVCLALMLIMTLWGISSMRNTSMALQGNYNARMKQISFEAAEFAIVQAGQLIQNQVTSTNRLTALFNGTNGRYSLVLDSYNLIPPALPLNGQFEYNNIEEWDRTRGDMSFIEIQYDQTFDKQPLAVIEYIGRTAHDNGGPEGLYAFRISAMGWGVDGKASTLIRTHYALNL